MIFQDEGPTNGDDLAQILGGMLRHPLPGFDVMTATDPYPSAIGAASQVGTQHALITRDK